MRAARPVPAESELSGASLDNPLAAMARAFSAKRIAATKRWPNRVHGRLFFSAGGTDFTCSATVISSGRGNLVNTAGHCVYDHDSGGFVSGVVFVPGYRNGKSPFGVWRATHAVTTGEWTALASIDHDVAMLRFGDRDGRSLQEVVGSRGIGFKQPLNGRLRAYGYPASPARKYDGEDLVRCTSRAKRDRVHGGSIGIGCDMGFGASGGGWVAQNSFVVAATSHGHGSAQSIKRIYGPRFRAPARKLYTFSGPGYPSVGPVRCGDKLATSGGSDRGERIVGSKRRDVIATLGGDDVVRSTGGKDLICGGDGDDRLEGGPGRDRLLGGNDEDVCDGGLDRDRATDCERTRRVP
jgi:V8-like Glu-specific endopeptidase